MKTSAPILSMVDVDRVRECDLSKFCFTWIRPVTQETGVATGHDAMGGGLRGERSRFCLEAPSVRPGVVGAPPYR